MLPIFKQERSDPSSGNPKYFGTYPNFKDKYTNLQKGKNDMIYLVPDSDSDIK